MSVKLKPCPFCGDHTPEIEQYGNRRQSTQYSCSECGCRLETSEEWGYGGRWNDRPEEDKLTARISVLHDALMHILGAVDGILPEYPHLTYCKTKAIAVLRGTDERA